MENKVNWKTLLEAALLKNKDELESICVATKPVIDSDGFYDATTGGSCEITDMSHKEMVRLFSPGYGSPEGSPFYAWGKKFIYFAFCYDGAESVDSVPRNPTTAVIPEHVGW